MKIATFNVNGVNGRLGLLLEWLEEAAPDVVCLQELKAPQEKFPAKAIEKAGYGAAWHGQKSWNGVAILARDADPIETRRGLPGDPEDLHSRYIEAAVQGVLIACLYAPNGNPAPGPKFAYKLAWYERFLVHAQALLETGAPIVLAGDYNVMPTDLDVYKPERWRDDALFRPQVREAFSRLREQGWTDAIRKLHRASASIRSGIISGTPGAATPACGSTTCCSAPRSRTGCGQPASTATFAVVNMQATMRRPGSNSPTRPDRSPSRTG